MRTGATSNSLEDSSHTAISRRDPDGSCTRSWSIQRKGLARPTNSTTSTSLPCCSHRAARPHHSTKGPKSRLFASLNMFSTAGRLCQPCSPRPWTPMWRASRPPQKRIPSRSCTSRKSRLAWHTRKGRRVVKHVKVIVKQC